mgnify:CR=1 FL=1
MIENKNLENLSLLISYMCRNLKKIKGDDENWLKFHWEIKNFVQNEMDCKLNKKLSNEIFF